MPEPLKIMMVDDDQTTLAIVSAALEEKGHEVTQRETAIGTTLAILRAAPHVVVLDVRMPGLSGDKLAALIADRRLDPPPIVILHSGSSRAELDQLARKCGAAGVIEKSGNPREFIQQFERIVAGTVRRRSPVRAERPT